METAFTIINETLTNEPINEVQVATIINETLTTKPIDEVKVATTIVDAKLLGISSEGATRLFSINDIKGDFKGLALADTNPGIPVLSQYFNVIPGITYIHFINSAGNAITVPKIDNGETVVDAKVTWTGSDWVLTYAKTSIESPNSVKKEDLTNSLSYSLFDEGFFPKSVSVKDAIVISNEPYSEGTALRLPANKEMASDYIMVFDQYNKEISTISGKLISFSWILEHPLSYENQTSILYGLRIYRPDGGFDNVPIKSETKLSRTRRLIRAEVIVNPEIMVSFGAYVQFVTGGGIDSNDREFKIVSAEYVVLQSDGLFDFDFFINRTFKNGEDLVKYNFSNNLPFFNQAFNGATAISGTSKKTTIPIGYSGTTSYVKTLGSDYLPGFIAAWMNPGTTLKCEWLIKLNKLPNGLVPKATVDSGYIAYDSAVSLGKTLGGIEYLLITGIYVVPSILPTYFQPFIQWDANYLVPESGSFEVIDLSLRAVQTNQDLKTISGNALTTSSMFEQVKNSSSITYENEVLKYIVETPFFNEVFNGAMSNSSNSKKITIPTNLSGSSSYVKTDLSRLVNNFSTAWFKINTKIRMEWLIKTSTNVPQSVFSPNANSNLNVKLISIEKLNKADAVVNFLKLVSEVQVLDILPTELLPYIQQTVGIQPVGAEAWWEVAELLIYLIPDNPTTLKSKNTLTNGAISDTKSISKSQMIMVNVGKVQTPGLPAFSFIGNRCVQDALDSIVDASEFKQYEIVVHEGIYEALIPSDFSAAGGTSFIAGKSNVSIRGVSESKVVFKGQLADNLGANFPYEGFQTMFWHADHGTLSNVTVSMKNGRYAIHIDAGAVGLTNFYEKFQNVKMEHYGNTNDALNWRSWHAEGIGMSQGLILEHDGCQFKTPECPLYFHTNANYEKESRLIYKNCSFFTTSDAPGAYAVMIQSLGSRKNDELTLEGCAFEGTYLMKFDDLPDQRGSVDTLSYNNFDVKVKGFGNSPLLLIHDFKGGMALRVISKSTAAISSVRFLTTGNAFSTLIKDQYYGGGTHETDLREINVNGYAYRDGAEGLRGYAIGKLDLSGAFSTPGSSIGRRLGNCATNNKNLLINIDGQDYNINFSKDYTNISNAVILAEINSVVGSAADVDLYSVAYDYYPEFTDVLHRAISSEQIRNGDVVVKVSGKIRKAKITDKKIYGVAIDDINTGTTGRVIIKGLLQTDLNLRFHINMETQSSVIYGDQLGLSSIPGKITLNSGYNNFFCVDEGILSFNL